MSHPLVSIIIPTYNRAHLLGETLDSVLAQTYQNWECLVVDDGSTDATEALVQTYIQKDSRFHYHKRPDSHLPGGNGARNYGFEVSQGEFLVFLDSDDLLMSFALQNRIQAALSNQAEIMVTQSGVFKLKIGDIDKVWNVVSYGTTVVDFLIRFLNVDMPWQTAGVTWSRRFFNKCGMWHPTLTAWQDWEMHCRALIQQPKMVVLVDKADNYYRYLTNDGIATTFKDKAYLNAVSIAILSIYKQFLTHKALYKTIKLQFEVLVFYMIIKRPVSLGYHKFPLVYLFKFPFSKGRLSRYRFIKIYIIELLSRSTKIRKFLLGAYYKKHQRYLTLKTTHLK